MCVWVGVGVGVGVAGWVGGLVVLVCWGCQGSGWWLGTPGLLACFASLPILLCSDMHVSFIKRRQPYPAGLVALNKFFVFLCCHHATTPTQSHSLTHTDTYTNTHTREYSHVYTRTSLRLLPAQNKTERKSMALCKDGAT